MASADFSLFFPFCFLLMFTRQSLVSYEHFSSVKMCSDLTTVDYRTSSFPTLNSKHEVLLNCNTKSARSSKGSVSVTTTEHPLYATIGIVTKPHESNIDIPAFRSWHVQDQITFRFAP